MEQEVILVVRVQEQLVDLVVEDINCQAVLVILHLLVHHREIMVQMVQLEPLILTLELVVVEQVLQDLVHNQIQDVVVEQVE